MWCWWEIRSGMVIQGHDTTVPVTVEDVVYHTRAVARGLHRPFLVADLRS